jgi:hypothetical protein
MKQAKKTYNSFSEYYREPEFYSNITELLLTSAEGFLIRDTTDMDPERLTSLHTLDVTDNMLNKLFLKAYSNLKKVNAARNMIMEVNLSLPKLIYLDLSNNMISKMFDLSGVPALQNLNLSNNLLARVYFNELKPVANSLKDLNISFNKLNYEADEFISFIEGLKVSNLVTLSIEGNDFITTRPLLTNTYKELIIATLHTLTKINDETILVNRRDLNAQQIIRQILENETTVRPSDYVEEEGGILTSDNDFQHKSFLDSPRLEEESLLEALRGLNMIIERLNILGGNNLQHYLSLLQKMNLILKFEPSYILPDNNGYKILEYATDNQDEFSIFLTNCLMLIELNATYEESILNYIGLLALYENGIFCENCFKFFESLYSAHGEKIKKVLTSTIIPQLEKKKELPFNILQKIIDFKKATEIDINSLYINLIPNIIDYFHKNALVFLSNFRDTTSNKEQLILNYRTCINFINAYIILEDDGEEEDNGEEKLQNHGENGKLDVIAKPENEKKPNNEKVAEEEDVAEIDSASEDEESDFVSKDDAKTEESEEEEEEDSDGGDEWDENEDGESEREYRNNVKNINKSKGKSGFPEGERKKEKGKGKLVIDDYLRVNLLALKDSEDYQEHLYKFILLAVLKRFQIDIFEGEYSLDRFFTDQRLLPILNEVLELLTNLFTGFWAKTEDIGLKPEKIEEIQEIEIFTKYIGYFSQFFKLYLQPYLTDHKCFDNVIMEKFKLDRNKITKSFFEANEALIKIFDCYSSLLTVVSDKPFKAEIKSETCRNILSILCLSINSPYVLTGACKFLSKVLSRNDIKSDLVTISKIFTSTNDFQGLLKYLDINEPRYKSIQDYVSQHDKSVEKIKDFQQLQNKTILNLFTSIINIFQIIALFSKDSSQITNNAIAVMDKLRENRQLEILGNCLKIPEDQVKVETVKCLYYFDLTIISTDIINQIINIISKYDSVTEGDTEIILSYVYIILNEIAIDIMKGLSTIKNFSCLSQTIELSLEFLEKNLNRNPSEKDEVEQRNSFATALIVFLNTCSRSNIFTECMIKETKIALYRTILLHDLNYYIDGLPYLPIELERTQLGNYLAFNYEITKTNQGIPPFTYVWLRIMIKVADILGNIIDFSYSADYQIDMEKMDEELQEEMQMRVSHRIINEHLNWYDFNTDLKQWVIQKKSYNRILKDIANSRIINWDLENKDKIRKLKNYINFEIKDYYFAKSKYYEQGDKQKEHKENQADDKNKEKKMKRKPVDFRRLKLEHLIKEHINFSDFYSFYQSYIMGETSNLREQPIKENLQHKYNEKINKTDIILEKFKDYKASKHKEIETDVLITKSHTDMLQNRHKNVNSSLLDAIEGHFAICDKDNLSIYKETNDFVFNYFNDIKIYDKYGFNNFERRTTMENENNPHLRSLMICALLRSLYCIQISPAKKVRQDFVHQLFLDDKFKKFILFIGTGLDNDYNISHKAICLFEKLFTKSNLFAIIRGNIKSKKKKEDSTGFSFKINDEKLFTNFYVCTLYLERVLFNIHECYFKFNKTDLIILRDSLLAVKNFIDCLTNIKFQVIDNNFLIFSIYKKLFNKELLDMICYSVDKTKIMRIKALCKIVDICQVPEAVNIQEDNHTPLLNYMFYYIAELEKFNVKMFELISTIVEIYPESRNLIYSKFLWKYEKTENALNKRLKDHLFEEEIKLVYESLEESHIKKQKKIDKFSQLQKKIKNNIRLQFEKFGIIEVIQFFEVCVFQDLINKSNKQMVTCVMTNTNLMFYEYSEDNESFFVNIFTPILDIELKNIEIVAFYEYFNRILFKTKEHEFSVFFKRCLESREFIYTLKYFNNGTFKFKRYVYLQNQIVKLESEDLYIKAKIKERQKKLEKHNIKKEDKKVLLEAEANKINQAKKAELDALMKEFPTLTSLELNMYTPDTLFNSNLNIFIVGNDYKTFIDYITPLFGEPELLIKNRKIVYISDFYLYIFKENFKKFERMPTEEEFDNELYFENKNNYDLILQIKLANIDVVKRKENMTIEIMFKEDDLSNKLVNTSFKFEGYLEYIAFVSKIHRSLVKINF